MKHLFAALFLAGVILLGAAGLRAEEEGGAAGMPHAYVIEVRGVISPATYDLINRHLKVAASRDADIVVLEMHTPGGLYDSMQQIIQAIIDSEIPVATYVSPSGSHAASAGTYILYASHIAAMAPSTNLGAATPIQMTQDGSGGEGGGKDGKGGLSTLEHKMVNDASAYIRGLAELRGRNAEWAEKAVREAESLTSSEALAKKVIDVVAEDIDDLLRKIDGKTVKMAHGKTMTLKTKGAKIETIEPDWRHDLLEVITHPNVAFILMTLGSYGLIYEFANPGALFPGILGAICLLLGLFAMNILPINYSGLALLFLGIALMAAEAFTTTFGILGISGAAAFALGAVMLIKSDMPGYGIDWWVIGSVTLMTLGFLSVVLTVALRAQRKPGTTGVEELLSSTAEVLHWSGGEGEVRVTGEIWRASAAPGFIIQRGDKVKVVEVNGLELKVAPDK
jgi:membrane-bound serine protease (ClpP class)